MRKHEYSPRCRSIVEVNEACGFKSPICQALPQLLSKDCRTTPHFFHETTFTRRDNHANGRIVNPTSQVISICTLGWPTSVSILITNRCDPLWSQQATLGNYQRDLLWTKPSLTATDVVSLELTDDHIQSLGDPQWKRWSLIASDRSLIYASFHLLLYLWHSTDQ